MFFFASKLLDLAFAPLTWVMGLLALSLVLRSSSRRRAAALAAVGLLWLFSTSLVSNALVRFGEGPPAPLRAPRGAYDGAIVLGGALDQAATRWSGAPQYNGGVDRLLAAASLLKAGTTKALLLSGGSVEPDPGLTPESTLAKGLLAEWGVAPSQLLVEAESRNTHENAVESVKRVRAQGWKRVLLVTSALHMPRALGCFRAEGLTVEPFPADFRGAAPKWSPGELLPRSESLDQSTAVLRELAGRAVYRVRGYSR